MGAGARLWPSRRPADLPWLMLLPSHALLRRANGCTSCRHLPRLSVQVPPEVAVLLWERSNGLPSFLEQLVVFLQARSTTA